jgi:hypothetical protein
MADFGGSRKESLSARADIIHIEDPGVQVKELDGAAYIDPYRPAETKQRCRTRIFTLVANHKAYNRYRISRHLPYKKGIWGLGELHQRLSFSCISSGIERSRNKMHIQEMLHEKNF